MQKTLELLKSHPIIRPYDINDYQSGENFYFLKTTIFLLNDTELHIREFISEDDRHYSYHWQNTQGNLIIRWDNAPHHKKLKTFPYHKHSPDLEESKEVSLEEVLRAIEKRDYYLIKFKRYWTDGINQQQVECLN